MNYAKIYEDLIARRRALPAEGYVEEHHVVPRAEGGSDDPANLVKLPAREHYVAHMLLARIYDDIKMWCALWYMSTSKRYRTTSRAYEAARKKRSAFMSQRMRELDAEGRLDKWKYSQLGRPVSDETRAKLRIALRGNTNGRGKHNISSEGWARISAAHKGKALPAEVRAKVSAAHKGKTPWNKGGHISEEAKAKLRQANLGKKQSEETKRKRNAKLKGHPSYTAGMKWWNNGTEQIFSRESPPGWQPGRIYRRKKAGG